METAEEAEGSAYKEERGETLEDMLSRHRQELAKLQNKEISLKKAAARGSKAEQKVKKKQVEEEMSQLQSQLKAEHKRELSSLGYKTNGSTEKDSLDILVKVIAGVNVTAHGDSAKPSKGAKRRERRAQQEAAREQRIQDEQSNMISNRMIENERLELKLEPLGLTINEIKPDGHCLYRAVEDQLSLYSNNNSPYSFLELRKMAANYMKKHATDFLPFFLSEGKIEADSDRPLLEKFEKYCEEVETTAAWGGQLELGALTHCLNKHIIIYSDSFPDVEMGKEYKCENGIGMSNPSIMLCYHRHAYGLGEHYNSVVPNTVSGVPKSSNYGVEYGSSKFSVSFPGWESGKGGIKTRLPAIMFSLYLLFS